MLIYVVGLLITGLCIGNMEQFQPVHGFLTIGLGFTVLGIFIMLLNYLDGKKE